MNDREKAQKMIAFVILHYLSEKMTIECVDKLINNFGKSCLHIVIVDNASSNGSGLRIKERYAKETYCTVILNEKNLGFAKGNNVGYMYAKETLKADYIIIMNNDVLIEDVHFLQKMSKIYEDTEYAVLGPDIIACKRGIHQNPMSLNRYSKCEVEKIISDRKQWLAIYPFHYLIKYTRAKVSTMLKHTIKRKSSKNKIINPYASEKQIINPVLHGACYIFSKKFIENEEIAFHPGTFLYFEEDILHYMCMEKGYKMLYDSSITVNHMEDVSTNIQFKSEYAKRKMKYKNLINSASVLLDLMDKDK